MIISASIKDEYFQSAFQYVSQLLATTNYVWGGEHEEFLEEWKRGRVFTWIAVVGAFQPVGVVHAHFKIDNDPIECEGHFAFERAGYKIAQQAIQAALLDLRGHVTTVVGRIHPDNTLALRMAQRLDCKITPADGYVEALIRP